MEDDAWFAERAAQRAKRAEERERRRLADAKLLAEIDSRSAQRQERREVREEILAKAESDSRIRQASRSTLYAASSSGAAGSNDEDAAERRRIAEEEEAERQRVRAEEKKKREAEREAARLAEEAREAEEERLRQEREQERRRKREELERAAEEERRQYALERERKAQELEARRQAEQAAEIARQEALEAQRKQEEEKRKAEEIARKAEEDKRKAEDARKAEEARIAAEEEEKALKAEEARIAAEKEEKARKAEEARLAAEKEEKARKAEEARIAAEKEEKARIAAAAEEEEKAREAEEAEMARIAAEEARIAEEEAKKARIAAEAEEKARIAAEEEEKARKVEEEAEKARLAAEAEEAEKSRLAAEEEQARAKALVDEEKSAKSIEEEASSETKVQEDDEDAILKADEERLAREEAQLAAELAAAEAAAAAADDEEDSEEKINDVIDEEEALLREEEALLRAEEEALKREEELQREEDARLLAEEEAELAREEAEFAKMQAEQAEQAAMRAEEEKKAQAEEDARIEAELLREDAERVKAEAEAAAAKREADMRAIQEEEARLAEEEKQLEERKRQEEAKKAEEEELKRQEAKKAEEEELKRQEDAKKAEEEAKKAAEELKRQEEAKKAEEEELKKRQEETAAAEVAQAEAAAKESEKPPQTAEVPATGAAKKAAFLAALNTKIGLGGPPPRAKPTIQVEAAQEETAPASTTTTDASASPSTDQPAEPSSGTRLTHLTHQRAKGPNRKHRATMAGIQSRMNMDGNQSFFVGELKATPHVDGQASSSTADESTATAAESTTTTTAAEPIEAPVVKKLPPGARGLPGMGGPMGGLMDAIKKSEQRRASASAGTNTATPADNTSSNQTGSPSSSASNNSSNNTANIPPLRLIQVRGKAKEIQVRLVEPVFASLSHDSAFILEDVKNSVLYVWSGYNANKMQTTKCLDLVNRINRGEHAGRATSHTFRAGEETDAFWNLLGVANPTPTQAKSAAQANALPLVPDTLYRVDPDNEGWTLTEMASETKSLERGLLWSDACYILDSGYEMRVWIGKSSPKDMRDAAFAQASEMLTKPIKSTGSTRPAWSQYVYKEADRGETALFTDKFGSWPAEYRPKVAAAPPGRARAATALPAMMTTTSNGSGSGKSSPASASPVKPTNSRMAAWDGASMASLERPASADKHLPDDGVEGHFTAWFQQEFEKKPLSKAHIGVYDDARCYIELYSWGMPGAERHMVYYWQGQASSSNDQGTTASLAREINERICKGSGQLVRVPQFHEPEHFLLCHAMQKQPYVSLSAALNVPFASEGNDIVVRLIHIRGMTANDTKAHQIEVNPSLLNSNDCFLLILGSASHSTVDDQNATHYLTNVKEIHQWNGSASNNFVRQYAQQVASRLANADANIIAHMEGSESSRFWKLLGQQQAGFDGYTKTVQTSHQLKIYMCTANSQEGFKIGRIWDYSNFDICADRVLVVEDSTHHVFVWMGSRTAEPERKLALESALSYAQTVSAPNPAEYMYEGNETLHFRSLFHGWTVKQKLDTKSVPGSGLIEQILPQYDATYPLEQLKNRDSLPPTVDLAHLEYHLNAEDFPQALKMTKEEFFALPEWKRLEAKKSSPIY